MTPPLAWRQTPSRESAQHSSSLMSMMETTRRRLRAQWSTDYTTELLMAIVRVSV